MRTVSVVEKDGMLSCASSNGRVFAPAREHFIVASAGIGIPEKLWADPADGVRCLINQICRKKIFPEPPEETRNKFYEMMRLGIGIPSGTSGVPLPMKCVVALGEELFCEPLFDRAVFFVARPQEKPKSRMLLMGKRVDFHRADWMFVDVESCQHFSSARTTCRARIEDHIERFLSLLSS